MCLFVVLMPSVRIFNVNVVEIKKTTLNKKGVSKPFTGIIYDSNASKKITFFSSHFGSDCLSEWRTFIGLHSLELKKIMTHSGHVIAVKQGVLEI